MVSVVDVAVLGGGCSPEHEISLQSAGQVLAHLDRNRFRPWPVYLTREGTWVVPDAPSAENPGGEFPRGGVPMLPGPAIGHLVERAGVTVCFPVLHGPFGEDGTVQGMLDLHGLAYVGSGCAASAMAMDKIRSRECLSVAGVPMPRAYLPSSPVHRADPQGEIARIREAVGFPCFLKTDLSGSSLGVSRAESPEDVASFLHEALDLGRRFLAEELVVGEEISVPVLGNSGHDPIALPPIGIYPRSAAFFTHAAKYDPSACDEVVPPRGLDSEQIRGVQSLAVRCHEALQCDGLSRTDMIVGSGGPRVLEVNTMPGFTTASLYPKCAAAHGMPYPDLLSRLIELATELPRPKEFHT